MSCYSLLPWIKEGKDVLSVHEKRDFDVLPLHLSNAQAVRKGQSLACLNTRFLKQQARNMDQ
jgi:hypothetical protein